MRRIVQQRQWTVETEPDPVAVVLRALIDEDLKLNGTSSDRAATLTGGSNLVARTIGAMFVNTRTLPKQVNVRLEHGHRLTITCESTLRWGAIMDRFTRRNYARAFTELGGSVDTALRSARSIGQPGETDPEGRT